MWQSFCKAKWHLLPNIMLWRNDEQGNIFLGMPILLILEPLEICLFHSRYSWITCRLIPTFRSTLSRTKSWGSFEDLNQCSYPPQAGQSEREWRKKPYTGDEPIPWQDEVSSEESDNWKVKDGEETEQARELTLEKEERREGGVKPDIQHLLGGRGKELFSILPFHWPR